MKHLQIHINDLQFEGESVLKNIHFVLNEKDKIAVVGVNGAGKSTLLKVLTGELTHYEGSIDNIGNLSVGYMKQIHSSDETKTVHMELKNAFWKIKKLEAQLQILEQKMSDEPENMNVIEEYTSLLEQFHLVWGNDIENKIHAIANGIGILDLLDKSLDAISGGQRTKVALAKVLLEEPDILFLDEPTNFIDMTSVEWLESYLQNKWTGGYMIVSHDREFLDKTCDKTYEIQPGRGITFYHTNYTDYLAERDKIEKKKLDAFKREEEYLKNQKNLINRFRAGSRSGWAKSREKSLEKREEVVAPYIAKKPRFVFSYTGECPEKILTFKECFIGRTDALFYIRELSLSKGQRIGIVWENGVGKSTFIKTILWQIPMLDGYFKKWKWIKAWYYSQMHEELFENETVRDNFHKHHLLLADQQIISLLTNYLFDYTILDRKVSELSGGQRAKLLFAILWQKEYNLLILDEPTNHLDYDTREALELALKNFEGAILFISHDRYYVNKLSTNIWFIENEELSVSYGNYEDFKFKKEFNIDMDMSLWDEEAELNLVLQEKLWESQMKKIEKRFGKRKKKKRK